MSIWNSNWIVAGKRLPLPRGLLVEVTSFCNLKCMMCPKTNNQVNTEESKVITWDIFEKIIPLLPALEAIDLTGVWGEAFLYPDIYFKILKRAKQDNVSVHTTSNGTLITDDIARQLVEIWLDRIIVSLDAATPETYSKVRPPGKFENVIAGLKHIQKWKKKMNNPFPRVDLAFVGMRSNIEEFPDVVRLGHELGVHQIALQAMGEYPGLDDVSVARNDKALGRKIFAEAKKIGDELGVEVVLFPCDQFEEGRQHRNQIEDHSLFRKDCREPWTKALISATGDVLPCCSSTEPMGNLRDSTFEEMWYGDGFSSLRQSILSSHPPKMCSICTGVAWIAASDERDKKFFKPLVCGHYAKKIKDHMRQYAAARWIKRGVDRLRGISVVEAEKGLNRR